MNENQLGKVIVALDHEKLEDTYRLVDEVGDRIGFYKVGPVLFSRYGAEVVKFLHDRKKKIFLDLKLHDIPNVVGATVKQIGELGVHFLTLHCMGGQKMLEAASAACRETPLKLLGVTLLTSHTREDSDQLGFQGTTADSVSRLLKIAVDARLAGVICSPNEITVVRESTLPGFQIVTPGIRLKQREVYQDDQQRVATPAEALRWGADYIVVGRPITQAREPKVVVERLFENG